MGKKEVTQILEEAKKEFDGKSIIAFIGKTYQGKTVISTLLYDAIFNFYYPKFKDKINARIMKGFDRLEKQHGRMFNKGRFPPATLPGFKEEVIIEVVGKTPPKGKIEFILRDISGEDLSQLLLSEYNDTSEIIDKIISKHKPANKDYGPLTYLIFSKIYVLLIDCEMSQLWRTEQGRLAQIIKSIRDIKEYVGETSSDKKINAGLAIIFTKSDKLPNQKPNAKEISPEELISIHLPALESSLDSSFSGKINYFKMKVDDVEEAQGEEAEQISKEEFDELSEETKEAQKQNNQILLEARKRKIDERVRRVQDKALQDALNQGQPQDTANQLSRQAGVDERKLAEKDFPIEQIDDTHAFTANFIHKKYFKIKLPLSYSSREYTRFISWIIDSLSG